MSEEETMCTDKQQGGYFLTFHQKQSRSDGNEMSLRS